MKDGIINTLISFLVIPITVFIFFVRLYFNSLVAFLGAMEACHL